MQLPTLPEPQIKFEDINSAKRKFVTTEGENEMNEKRTFLQGMESEEKEKEKRQGQGQVKKNE